MKLFDVIVEPHAEREIEKAWLHLRAYEKEAAERWFIKKQPNR